MKRLLGVLAVVLIAVSAVPRTARAGGQICDPRGVSTITPGYGSVGSVANACTFRIEVRRTPLSGGPPEFVTAFDVATVPGNDGEWGRPLLEAIQNHPAIFDTDPIEDWYWEGGLRKGIRMKVFSADPQARVAIRTISVSQGALPAWPTMPPLSDPASNWPPSPIPWTSPDYHSYNYDNTAFVLGLVGAHRPAGPPQAAMPESPAATDAPGFVTYNYGTSLPATSRASLWVLGLLTLTAGGAVLWRRHGREA